MTAIQDIAAERQRQIGAEGWTVEHDDEHDDGVLERGAASYALAAVWPYHEWGDEVALKQIWPWSREWWKPTGGRRRCLVKAGALIVAAIERMDRAEELKRLRAG